MLFNSIEFALFLPIVFTLYGGLTSRNSNAVRTTPRYSIFKYVGKNISTGTQLKAQNLFVIVASYVFYGWWDWSFLLLIAFTSLCSWTGGILINKYDNITSPHVFFLDELGEDLHNDLLYYYLNVCLFNSDKSQLIITSQETTLLSQDLINENRGVVWFVEKNKETASSEYSRGDSFGLHKNLSLYNSYCIGRIGAKPELGSIFINLEE